MAEPNRPPGGNGSRFTEAMGDAMPKFLMVVGVMVLIAVAFNARGLRVVSSTSAPTSPAGAAGSSTSASAGTAEASALSVTEHEWAVSPTARSVPAGAVTFAATNTGTTVHELVVLRTDA